MEVVQVEVEELGDQVEQALHNWSLEELSRPYRRLGSLNQQLQHQAALRLTLILLRVPHNTNVSCRRSKPDCLSYGDYTRQEINNTCVMCHVPTGSGLRG